MEHVNLNIPVGEVSATFQGNNFAIIEGAKDLQNFQDKTFLIECFLIVVVLNGHASGMISDEIREIQRGDFFVCNPRNIFEKAMMSLDFDFRAILVSPEFGEKIARRVNLDWTFLAMLKQHEIIHLNEQDLNRICNIIDLIKAKLEQPESPNKQNSIDAMLASMAYDLFDIRSREREPLPAKSYTSGENIFHRFMKMLQAPELKYSSVKDFAEAVNVTPKYFSAVCKQLTGKTASTIINDAIISRAIDMLCNDDKSIKEIAHELNFPNQSHFGSFFRRLTGLSPQHYRNKDKE